MAPRPIDAEKSILRITLPRALWLAGVVFTAGAWAALKLERIDNRLEAIQLAQQKAWTIDDQERQMNWLRWDNAAAPLKIREPREVVAARNP